MNSQNYGNQLSDYNLVSVEETVSYPFESAQSTFDTTEQIMLNQAIEYARKKTKFASFISMTSGKYTANEPNKLFKILKDYKKNCR